ncbi:hypothetical protein Lal_00036014 [Lupinus albus]|nr:hypothetical protein Lal_00036014 [Lupinus albus]
MMTRLLSYRVVLVLSVLVFMMLAQVDLAEGDARNYISWEDLQVDERRLELKSHDEFKVIVVDQHGKGHSKTVQGAVDMVPNHNTQRVKIYIYPGVYREKVLVPNNKPYISFIGRRNETSGAVITWNSKSSDRGPNGQTLGTYGSATVGIESDYFCATQITFEASTTFATQTL